MLRHIVMWKFREGTEREQKTFLEGLRGLDGVIPEIESSFVGENVKNGNYDAVLIAEFADRAALERYLADPRHVAVAALCKAIRTDRVAVDCTI